MSLIDDAPRPADTAAHPGLPATEAGRRLAAISVPAGMGASQLPIGMQLAAGFGQDMRVLELARELESAAPWPVCAPAFT